jgi:hypothetical protein
MEGKRVTLTAPDQQQYTLMVTYNRYTHYSLFAKLPGSEGYRLIEDQMEALDSIAHCIHTYQREIMH